jgi:hypothetical protein
MWTSLVARLVPSLLPLPADTLSSRIDVRPPALIGDAEPMARRALRWIGRGGPLGARRHDPAARLRSIREEFGATLDDVNTQNAGFLQHRVRNARSMRELWHLRPEIYNVIALHHSQSEAHARLARLNRHFPTRAPRSGFVPLED